MKTICDVCGSTYELEAKAPEVHQHVWSVAYRSTEGDKKSTRLHCRGCDEWRTEESHVSEGGGSVRTTAERRADRARTEGRR